MKNRNNNKIAIIGMGYVGLPLAIEFGKIYDTVGFDINTSRIDQLLNRHDHTKEIESNQFSESKNLSFTNDSADLADCDIFIITVPTPIDKYKKPDLKPLIEASRTVGNFLKKDDIVIYESTVFPGATEEVCVPILENTSGLYFNKDFFCGYSPERINPGDKIHSVSKIKKVTSGSTPEIADQVDVLYKSIISAGTHKAKNIRVAEAAKVIENTQRDINIALMNELAIIFNKLDIDTEAVLDAASTKWNFLPFKPGLVGGHCIGIDPYYLTHKAIEVGYNPEMILAGRRINDSMSSYVADQVFRLMVKKRIHLANANILIMGLTFKENCPDLRNSKAIDLAGEFQIFDCNVHVFDPWVNKKQAHEEYGIEIIEEPISGNYDGIIIAVAHSDFKRMRIEDIRKLGKKNYVLYDIKHILSADEVDGRL